MQTQERATVTGLDQAIQASQNWILSQQYAEGYWWSELESNVTMAAEVVLLHKIWGTDQTRPLHKVEAYLRREQREHGGWELFYGDGGHLSNSVEAYMALKLLGVLANDPAMVKAREFILAHGGITKCRVFTKFHLALVGCYDWRGVPSIPPWVMLLPQSFPIYEMSSWARGSTVPLLIVFDQEPVFLTDPAITLDELYVEGRDSASYEFPKSGGWGDIFLTLDKVFKLAEKWNLVPFRKAGLKAAEKWVLERQEETGDWGGIIPAMLNSLLALRCLGYDANDPMVERGMAAVDRFVIETETAYHVQPCVSPVWDTAWCIRALRDSGFPADHPDLVKAGEWIIDRQIIDYGDWAVKNKLGRPGAWAFEFVNRWYPDIDDSATVVMALSQLTLPNPELQKAAIARAVDWIATMQCKPGGWGAFDIDNDHDWLNELPYADLKAMIDPNTADVTARVVEMIGYLINPSLSSPSLSPTSPLSSISAAEPYANIPTLLPTSDISYPPRRARALDYLSREQEADGSWFGRWGVNYIYGTSGVLSALALAAPKTHRTQIERGAAWLISCQNDDGGWGETCFSYNDPKFKGQGDSTASQTAWALIGLLDAAKATDNPEQQAIERGVQYLIDTQLSDGRWDEAYFTGTGFPCHFYLKYHMYQQYFSLIALGRYQSELGMNIK